MCVLNLTYLSIILLNNITKKKGNVIKPREEILYQKRAAASFGLIYTNELPNAHTEKHKLRLKNIIFIFPLGLNNKARSPRKR